MHSEHVGCGANQTGTTNTGRANFLLPLRTRVGSGWRHCALSQALVFSLRRQSRAVLQQRCGLHGSNPEVLHLIRQPAGALKSSNRRPSAVKLTLSNFPDRPAHSLAWNNRDDAHFLGSITESCGLGGVGPRFGGAGGVFLFQILLHSFAQLLASLKACFSSQTTRFHLPR